METKTVTVRKSLIGLITSVVSRLNRRAARLGVDPIEMTFSESRILVFKDEITAVEKAVEVLDVTLSLNVPKLADWTFLATIQHLEGGNLLLTVPSAEATDLSAYRTCAPNCQHCNKPRIRKDTYVVRHLDGTMKQVGKDCLANFTGYGKTAEQAADYAEWLSKFLEFLRNPAGGDGDDDEGGYGGAAEGVGLISFLSHVVAVSRIHGFRTRKQAEAEMSSSTKDDALFNMNPPSRLSYKERERLIVPTDEDRDFALAARGWAATIEPKSDFDHNLKVIASADGVLFRNTGIAAYLIAAYRKHLGVEAERKARPESKHFGEPKVRLRKLVLTYRGNFAFDSIYGTTFIHRFVTEDGSDAIWKTGDNRSEFVEGKAVRVDATVKSHGDYKGRPQTVLTRMKIVE